MKLHPWLSRPFCFLCLLGSFVLDSCRPLFQRQVAGTILSLEGETRGTLGGRSVALTKGSWVYPGEKITTSADARLELLLLPGVLVALARDTEIEIQELRLARDGDETIRPMTSREAKLRLLRGALV